MSHIEKLLEGNREWVKKINSKHPDLFSKLAKGQSPQFLWIGCSDSRVPATEITNQLPGSIFVHRNIANLVLNSDFNLLSVLYYALYFLGIRDILVVGHHNCGGVTAALSNKSLGFMEGWIGHIRNISRIHADELLKLPTEQERIDRLCEINVIEQVKNLETVYFVEELVEAGEEIRLYGWLYDVRDGLIHELIRKTLRKPVHDEPHRIDS
jgi:carbonic anhydrase